MKQLVLGSVCGLITFFLILLLLTVENRTVYEEDLSSAATASMRSALEEAGRAGTMSDAAMEAVLKKNLQARMAEQKKDPSYRLVVRVAACDAERGLLSACFTERFTNPDGSEKEVSVRKTAVREREEEPAFVSYRFVLPRQAAGNYAVPALVSAYTTEEGEAFSVPFGSEDIGGFVCDRDGKRYSRQTLSRMTVSSYFDGATFTAVA